MKFFTEIIRSHELEEILSDSPLHGQNNISIGIVSGHDPEKVKKLMELWCQRVDTIFQMDIEYHGFPSEKAKYLNAHRGFTYFEFLDLFNEHIEEQEYPQYPVFNQLRKRKGGINTKKQRYTYLSRFDANEEDYLKLYLEEGGTVLLNFFLGALGRLHAQLPLSKLKQHTLVVAPSGTGKSELLRSLFYRIQKRYAKFSMVMIDPHGDLAESIRQNKLTYEQRERFIYIDPFLQDGYTPTFNPFSLSDRSERAVQHAAEQFIVALEEVLDREGGRPTETMIQVLEKALYFILGRKDSTILTLIELFETKSPLQMDAQLFDPSFDDHFYKPGNKTREGIHTRLSRLINNPTLRRVIGGQSTFDLEFALNGGKIIVFDLAGFGEMAQVTFGKFLMASIKSYIRKRKKNTGVPVMCFVDEAHAMVSGSFEFILAQLRGFGLHMVLATQHIGQLGDQVKDVKKNTAVKIVGGDIEDDVKEVIKVEKGLKLDEFEFVLKVRNKGQSVFKAPDFLLKNPGKYLTSEAEDEEIKKMQLDRYYKVTGIEDHKPRREAIKPDDENRKGELPSPPFNLFLGTDD